MIRSRRFVLKANTIVRSCPECGNNTDFKCISEQVCEDGCEVYVACACGHDPTARDPGYRNESVMGEINMENLNVALFCWNHAIDDVLKRH